uniref:Small ribosomal subunit protein uS15c n=1 Tax=Legenere valdiviana TaxID=2010882 RepID=A0A1Z2QUF3_9ASTR|nr:ribosomal protein S15 [Legenere valdiviana]YP_009403854.1 ribosomal protein S15 [Legenere valdiviana]ASA35115.1 ribosomal protein S15 [Legenere valdiviana]ASA35120.1 ribosomal protein S15 [Legenere valdiviana]
MVKNPFISIISHEENKENRGSVEFQVFSFTNKIQKLTSHLQLHKKDYLSERGLRKILGKRQRLLAYLSKKTTVHYKEFKELMAQVDKKKTTVHYKEFKELMAQVKKKTR